MSSISLLPGSLSVLPAYVLDGQIIEQVFCIMFDSTCILSTFTSTIGIAEFSLSTWESLCYTWIGLKLNCLAPGVFSYFRWMKWELLFSLLWISRIGFLYAVWKISWFGDSWFTVVGQIWLIINYGEDNCLSGFVFGLEVCFPLSLSFMEGSLNCRLSVLLMVVVVLQILLPPGSLSFCIIILLWRRDGVLLDYDIENGFFNSGEWSIWFLLSTNI